LKSSRQGDSETDFPLAPDAWQDNNDVFVIIYSRLEKGRIRPMYVTQEGREFYEQHGYLLLPGLFDAEEVEAMRQATEVSPRIEEHIRVTEDASGRKSRLAIWHELGDDIWAATSTCPRVANAVRILLGEEAAFFHGKVMLKEARSGGAWEWHQDYGYWYDQGFLTPRMLSVFVAIDPATRENGCLQVLRGSHKLERINHATVGTQTGVDRERMAQIEPLFEKVYCEMAPGTALLFHSNLFHCSGPNLSEFHRRAFIMCYTALDNPCLPENTTWRAAERRPLPAGSDDDVRCYLRVGA
jgi:ectoine hydroxylase-related dioxygenase (phytanoyl-CoA dioxygenase family)